MRKPSLYGLIHNRFLSNLHTFLLHQWPHPSQRINALFNCGRIKGLTPLLPNVHTALKEPATTLKCFVFLCYAPRPLQGIIAASCWICFGLILLVQATLTSIIILLLLLFICCQSEKSHQTMACIKYHLSIRLNLADSATIKSSSTFLWTIIKTKAAEEDSAREIFNVSLTLHGDNTWSSSREQVFQV